MYIQRQTFVSDTVHVYNVLYFANDAIILKKSGIINKADKIKYQLLLVTSLASRSLLF